MIGICMGEKVAVVFEELEIVYRERSFLVAFFEGFSVPVPGSRGNHSIIILLICFYKYKIVEYVPDWKTLTAFSEKC